MEQLGYLWTDFHEIWYEYFRKPVEKIQVSLKSDKNNGYFTWRPIYIYINISLSFSFFCEWEMFLTKAVYKIQTHILRSITFYSKSCCLWDNVDKYGTAREAKLVNITWRTRIACWKPKATDRHIRTLRICATYCSSTATVITWTRLNVTLIRALLVLWIPELTRLEFGTETPSF